MSINNIEKLKESLNKILNRQDEIICVIQKLREEYQQLEDDKELQETMLFHQGNKLYKQNKKQFYDYFLKK